MQVNINPGMAWVQGVYTATQGVYAVTNDATVTLPIAAASSVNDRIDLVILEVLDQIYSGSSNIAQLRVLTGTPSASPAIPTTGGSWIPIAEVYVAKNVTSIASSIVWDVRQFASAAGSPLPVVTASARTAMTGTPAGFSVIEIDTQRVYQWDGSNWNYQWGGTPPAVVLTPSNSFYNWSANQGGSYEYLRGTKVGSLIHVSGLLGNYSDIGSSRTMFTLPSGWAPERTHVMGCYVGNNDGDVVQLDVQSSGTVIVNALGDSWIGNNSWWSVDIHLNIRNNTVG